MLVVVADLWQIKISVTCSISQVDNKLKTISTTDCTEKKAVIGNASHDPVITSMIESVRHNALSGWAKSKGRRRIQYKREIK